MFKAGKIWGETELILANNALEFHRIDYKKGGVCSKHLHEWKWNGFYCMSGQLKIRVWQKDYDLVDETILNPGDFTAVKPGLYHSFEGMEDGVAFELYWANFSHNDIKRESVGHLKDIDGKIVRLDKNKKKKLVKKKTSDGDNERPNTGKDKKKVSGLCRPCCSQISRITANSGCIETSRCQQAKLCPAWSCMALQSTVRFLTANLMSSQRK